MKDMFYCCLIDNAIPLPSHGNDRITVRRNFVFGDQISQQLKQHYNEEYFGVFVGMFKWETCLIISTV
jgi:hypothetical protein